MSTVGRTPDSVEPRHALAVRAALAFLAVYWEQAVLNRELGTRTVKLEHGRGWEYISNRAQHITIDLADNLVNLGFLVTGRTGPEHSERLAQAIRDADAARFDLTPSARHELDRCLADYAVQMRALGVKAEVAR